MSTTVFSTRKTQPVAGAADDAMAPRGVPRGRGTSTVALLFFASGMAGLVYEVLWMRWLGLLFGNGVYAASAALTAFFLGLALGAWFWGHRAQRIADPLRAYGLLELGVALSAVGVFALLPLYRALLPLIFPLVQDQFWLLVGVKLALAVTVLVPQAFCMGGTLPLLAQLSVDQREQLGRRVSFLYAVNTVGAACGALLAGFWAPRWLGYSGCYLAVMALSAAVGGAALWLSRQRAVQPRRGPSTAVLQPPASGDRKVRMEFLAWLSGATTLALQVLWTRMFAQVLQNSVYTFAAILVVFLVCLALGAALANRLLASRRLSVEVMMMTCLGLGALLVGATPRLFDWLTGGMGMLGGDLPFDLYLLQAFACLFAVIGPAVTVVGAVFPLLIKLADRGHDVPGRLVGRLVSLNTIGAIAGSLLAGFVLLDLLGLWLSVHAIALLYLGVAVWIGVTGRAGLAPRWAVPAGLAVVAGLMLLNPVSLPAVRVEQGTAAAKVLRVWEGAAGTVAVLEKPAPPGRQADFRIIRVNNYYTLGGTGARGMEFRQGELPLLLHPKPQSAYFLGLGTGLTASASVGFPLRKIAVSELVPEVVEASRLYFTPFVDALFSDPRVKVLVGDGRNFLAADPARYDVIVGDLFVPWKAGTASLYTREHFETVKRRLNEGGLFMQWLPAYQVSDEEFGMIARTLMAVFPQVTLWRADFNPRFSLIGLLAYKNRSRLSPWQATRGVASGGTQAQASHPLLTYYVGNLTAAPDIIGHGVLNTDDRPAIGFLAPVLERERAVRRLGALVGVEWIRLVNRLATTVPPRRDPYLQDIPVAVRDLRLAGLNRHRATVLKARGQNKAAASALAAAEQIEQQAAAVASHVADANKRGIGE